jgi:uncharacterized membrane protein YqiK
VKPMEKIDSIRIMQVDGLNNGGGAGSGGNGANSTTGIPATGNLAEQAVGAALRYRAYAPVLDKLLNEVGLSGGGLDGLVAAAQGAAPSTRNGEAGLEANVQLQTTVPMAPVPPIRHK